ncbi:hypothetical protein FB451DRAFT_1373943 [Mycena latifolia]|nr:hypothetical protein FB451DRAFT_1373943 [Mycena latifolia]
MPVKGRPGEGVAHADAIRAKEKGNKAFKESNWFLATQRYQQAEQLDHANPVYPSNLSAALFEMGDYSACVAAILRSCSQLDFETNTNAALASRLSVRLAKSLSQAFAAGNPIPLTALSEQIDRIKKAGPATGPESNAWAMWHALALDPSHALQVEHARARLLKLPILKQVPETVCEYFTISHDDVKSMLDKSAELLPGAGEDAIYLGRLAHDQLSSLTFLLGGVGDARYVFGTLVGIHEASHRISPAQRDLLRVHITLLDIKEHALARDLVVLFILSKIMVSTDQTEKLELQATVFYVYTALVMPSYCHQRFCDAVAEMQAKISQDSENFLPWIRLDRGSVDQICAPLRLWTSLPKKSTSDFISRHQFSPNADEVAVFTSRVTVYVLTLWQNGRFKLLDEAKWYAQVKAFLPPAALWDRHPEFSVSRQLNAPNAKARVKTAGTQIRESWVVNPTLFDDPRQITMESVDRDTFGIVRQLAAFHKRHPVTPFNVLKDSPAFGYVTGFFDSVITAIRSLDGKFLLEFIHGDLLSELVRMRMYPSRRVELNLPVKYTKMWLSNVPDYTNGPMGTALFVVPSLQDTTSTVGANHLLSYPGFMAEPAAFSNTYAHLEGPAFPSYLGCRVVEMAPIDVTILAPLALPRPNAELAKREALKTWLIRVFLCTLVNGRRNRITKILTPSTLVAFMHLLIHLHKVGYPGHWLGDFLQNVLCNNLVTNILPYTAMLPISLGHDWTQGRPDARLRLQPWIPDLEAIVARIRPALPFAFALPPSFPVPTDIARFRAKIRPYEAASTPDPIASLLFFDAAKVRLRDIPDWQAYLSAVLRGEGPGRAADICVVSMDAIWWDEIGEVWWRMSRARVTHMKKAGEWEVVIYGTHDHQIISSSAAAITWRETNDNV